MIGVVLTYGAVLLALALYTLLVLLVFVPRAYNNGRIDQRIEHALERDAHRRECHGVRLVSR